MSHEIIGLIPSLIFLSCPCHILIPSTVLPGNNLCRTEPPRAPTGQNHCAEVLVGLTAAQTFEGTGLYAASGGIGPRLYDALIGGAAVVHGIPGIVTWNVGHMRSLFPNLDVLTPEAFAAGQAT